jgi:hypothetical protein
MMIADHTPHPPQWRQILSLPHTRLGWWTIGLASPALILWVYAVVYQQASGVSDRLPILIFVSEQTPLLIFAWLLSAVAGAVFGLVALARERSWLVWGAQVPGMLVFSYAIRDVISMSMDIYDNLWVTFPISVLIWVVTAFLISMRRGWTEHTIRRLLISFTIGAVFFTVLPIYKPFVVLQTEEIPGFFLGLGLIAFAGAVLALVNGPARGMLLVIVSAIVGASFYVFLYAVPTFDVGQFWTFFLSLSCAYLVLPALLGAALVMWARSLA